jgi:hypothetical protein
MDVLLEILFTEFLLALTEAALVVLLGVVLTKLLLALAEPAEVVLAGILVGMRLACCETST